jgi:hypothetical protein
MRDDFQAALARVQSDYDFYVRLQVDPEDALTGYALSPQERSTLGDPDLLAEALQARADMRLPSITVKISGTHDWVNRTPPKKATESAEEIAREVQAVRSADGQAEREESTLRLIKLIG